MSNAELIRNLYAEFARGNVPAVLAAFHPNIEWREADNFIYAEHNPYIGPQRILEGVFMRLATEFTGFHAGGEEFLDAGNRVVVLGTYTGKYNATGKSIRAQFVHVWTLVDGKITRFQQYTDTKQFADAIKP